MIQKTYSSKEEWLADRKGKITGSRLGDILVKRGTKEKKGFYELIAERLAEDAGDEDPMLRGQRLESEAVERFCKETGKEVDASLIMWMREDNESIAVSPDAEVIGEEAAVEAKCLNSASHIQAYLTQEIPTDYQPQKIQYFAVNDNLKKLYFAFYDPRYAKIGKDFFVIEVKREDVEDEVAETLATEKEKLERIDQIVLELTKF